MSNDRYFGSSSAIPETETVVHLAREDASLSPLTIHAGGVQDVHEEEILAILLDILHRAVGLGLDLRRFDICGQIFEQAIGAASTAPDSVSLHPSPMPLTAADITRKEPAHEPG